MADTLSIISLVSFIVAGVCLALAIFFWISFRIPKVIGDLSGRTARKSIAKMRTSNEESGNKSYRPSVTNVSRGKLTDTMPESSKLQSQDTDPLSEEIGTGETGVLAENRASTNNYGDSTVLLDNSEETDLLANIAAPARKGGGKKLTMLDEDIQVHTEEVIE